MLFIAHRGLTEGPNPEKENHPDTIALSIRKGFEVEIDLNVVDNKPVLGHDKPQYEISLRFLKQDELWIHAKTIESLLYCTKFLTNANFFYHEEDPCTITSHQWIWTHPHTKLLTEKSIAVMPERVFELDQIKTLQCAGICSDYVDYIRRV